MADMVDKDKHPALEAWENIAERYAAAGSASPPVSAATRRGREGVAGGVAVAVALGVSLGIFYFLGALTALSISSLSNMFDRDW